MLIDASRFAFVRHLQAGFATFVSELAALRREEFALWPDRGAYGGEWLTFPLFLASHPADVDRVFARNQARCPLSTDLLRAAPGVVSAGFSWMEPGCHIYEHVDAKPANLLRAHLGLVVPEGALMRVGSDRHTWGVGRALVFDGYVTHETANTAATRRVILLADAVLAGEELAYLADWRRQHGIDMHVLEQRGVVTAAYG